MQVMGPWILVIVSMAVLAVYAAQNHAPIRTHARAPRNLVYPPKLGFVQLIAGTGVPVPLESQQAMTVGWVVKAAYNAPDNASYYTNPYVTTQKRSLSSYSVTSRFDIYRSLQTAFQIALNNLDPSIFERSPPPISRQLVDVVTLSGLIYDGPFHLFSDIRIVDDGYSSAAANFKILYGGKDCILRAICETSQAPFQGASLVSQILHVILTPSTTDEEAAHPMDRMYEGAARMGQETDTDCRSIFPECHRSIADIFSVLS